MVKSTDSGAQNTQMIHFYFLPYFSREASQTLYFLRFYKARGQYQRRP